MFRNSCPSPKPQIGPILAVTSSPNSRRTRFSQGLYPVARTIRSAASLLPSFIRTPSATKESMSANWISPTAPPATRSEQPTLK